MIAVEGFQHFGGQHAESATLKNLMSFHNVSNPISGEPLSESLCFGIAGGIGAGYSFCPSVPRHGYGSGVFVVGRHKAYTTGADWYQGFFDRLGIEAHITETAAKGKARDNLIEELAAGRPTVVWCGRTELPFLGNPKDACGLFMHSFLVYSFDADNDQVLGSDRAATQVSLTVEQLAHARNAVCSHKNRTLTISPPKSLTKKQLLSAVEQGLKACAGALLKPKMKTFGLPGLINWSKMICNDNNKDGWGKVFGNNLLYNALRDVFDSIETAGTGGGLYRGMYADFLGEASEILGKEDLKALAEQYRELAKKWTHLAESALPTSCKPLKQTRDLLRKKRKLLEDKGERGKKSFDQTVENLGQLEDEMHRELPLSCEESLAIREGMREQILELHDEESELADRLASCVGGKKGN